MHVCECVRPRASHVHVCTPVCPLHPMWWQDVELAALEMLLSALSHLLAVYKYGLL
jgi:hypothetical protein